MGTPACWGVNGVSQLCFRTQRETAAEKVGNSPTQSCKSSVTTNVPWLLRVIPRKCPPVGPICIAPTKMYMCPMMHIDCGATTEGTCRFLMLSPLTSNRNIRKSGMYTLFFTLISCESHEHNLTVVNWSAICCCRVAQTPAARLFGYMPLTPCV